MIDENDKNMLRSDLLLYDLSNSKGRCSIHSSCTMLYLFIQFDFPVNHKISSSVINHREQLLKQTEEKNFSRSLYSIMSFAR